MRTARILSRVTRSLNTTPKRGFYVPTRNYATENKQRKAAFIMTGSGYLDGNEIGEAVSFIIACSQANVQASFFAPQDKEIEDVFLHTTKALDPAEERITHKEVARITRGPTRDVNRLSPEEFDLLVVPGGAGNIRTLSNFEQKQYKGNIEIDSDVKNAILSFHNQKKPIVASSHAVLLLVKALQGQAVQIALGKTNEKPVSDAIETLTGKAVETSSASQVQTDDKNRIVSVAGFGASAGATFSDVFTGARDAINAALGLLKK